MNSKQTRRRIYNVPGHAHELTFSCYQRWPLLSKDRTRQWLCEAIDSARDELDFAVWAYVIMPEHVHLLIWRKRAHYNVSTILSEIKLPVSRQAMNYLRETDSPFLERLTRQRGKRTESLFWQSGGGYDRNIDDPRTLWKVLEYIHLNPVRRGLVELAEAWRWSSAGQNSERGDVFPASPLSVDPIPSAWCIDGNW